MAIKPTLSTYREVLKQAYRMVKQHKFLWIFGFFAAFLGTGGEFESLFRNYSNLANKTEDIFSLQSIYQGGVFSAIYDNIVLFFGNYPWQAFFFILMIVVLAIVLIWLAIVSQIAIFDAANKLSKNKKVRYGDGYHVGNKHFGSVLLINIIVKVLLYGILIVIGAPLITWFLLRGSIVGGIAFIILIFLIYIPLSIIVSFVVRYAIAYIVIKEKKTGEAVRLGWELLKKNWLVTIEMAALVLLIGLVVALAILLVIGITAIPFILISVASVLFGSQTAFASSIVFGVIVWFVVVAIIGSAYVAFQYSAWTLLFLKLVDNKAESKLKRWFGKLSPEKG